MLFRSEGDIRGAASDIKRLQELEQENGLLKRMYADLSLEGSDVKIEMV